MLEIKDLDKSFGGLKAVDNLNFSVSEGQIIGLIGPNGAGKTTVFNLITGVYAPDNGSIRLGQKEIAGLPPHAICRMGVARTFQITKPFGEMSILDNVMVGSFLKNRVRNKAELRAEEILDFVGLKEKMRAKAKYLTLAERKLLEIARAMATDPQVLLLDEVMSGLNEKETKVAIDLINKIRKVGITILVIEHIFKVILTVTDRVIVLDQGRKIAEDTALKIVENENVINAYLGDEYGSS